MNRPFPPCGLLWPAMTNFVLRFHYRCAIVLAICLVSACPQRTEIWVAPGSKRVGLTFALGVDKGRRKTVALGMFAVSRCTLAEDDSGSVLWRILADDRARMVDSIAYGKAPNGFRATVAPSPLAEGCYIAQTSGTGRMRFRVASDGNVTDEGRPW